jgi:hypothetical protein
MDVRVQHPTYGIGIIQEDRGNTVIVKFEQVNIWENTNVIEVSKSMLKILGEKKTGSRWER